MNHPSIKLYNTLTRHVDEFKPTDLNSVGIYTCGPTVYSYAHVGNMRGMIFSGVLTNILRHAGYDVKWVVNVTDVGHLAHDADVGDDKMEKSAATAGKSVWDIAKFYEDAFWKDWDLLNIVRPDFTPHATKYIQQQIDFVLELEKRGYTYKTADGIYFDTSKYPEYTNLSGINIGKQSAGHRIDMGDKKNPSDFALWKFSPTNEQRQMEWNSPWGIGFPGWHVECSAMGTSILGDKIDIHTGGENLVMPHHSAECAQNFGYYGHDVVQRWMHWGLLVLDGNETMSKSSGNSMSLQNFIDRGIDPLAYRYLCLTAHYRKQLMFSDEILSAAATSYKNLRKQTSALAGIPPVAVLSDTASAFLDKFDAAIYDDLATPVALTVLRDVLSSDLSDSERATLVADFDSVFGLKLLDPVTVATIPNEITELAERRMIAKKSRDFATADTLRAEITAAGYTVMDTADGFKIEKN